MIPTCDGKKGDNEECNEVVTVVVGKTQNDVIPA